MLSIFFFITCRRPVRLRSGVRHILGAHVQAERAAVGGRVGPAAL